MRRSPRRPNPKSAEPKYIVLGVVSVLVLITLFAWGQRQRVRVDSDNCLRDDPPSAQVAVLLDPSDSLSAVQRGSVASRVVEAVEGSMPERTEVRLYTIARAGRGDATPELRVCLPPHPDNVGAVEAFWTNRTIIEREYSDGFRAPLRSRLNALLDAPSDTVSPIVEAVQAAVVDAFRPRGASMPRYVLIVSDMVQNSSDLSFFREPPDFARFVRNPNYNTLRVDLNDVEVTVFLLARRGVAGRVQAGELRSFWEEYFIDQGAAAEARPRWVAVEGG